MLPTLCPQVARAVSARAQALSAHAAQARRSRAFAWIKGKHTRKEMAVSGGQCNEVLVELLGWSMPVQGLSWPSVE
ncbi:hypothetical protein, partial [Phytohabitans aurantiacus]|uniref:hypothetical protein n=1 Tax=Phytohabitans aurantiacus TaxID=3016789 RepID=UPI0024939C11